MKQLIGYYYREVFNALKLYKIWYIGDEGIVVSEHNVIDVGTAHKLECSDEFRSDADAVKEYKYKYYSAIMMAEVGKGVTV